ncbi:P-loop ATPase, Sll1717 family [Paraburkholderia diazotrophica]|uniref:P-loop ATPase, Sll1717 family n=1 Tax=Paraburkholderia diazotrophica TaxID=667676 RepID=UPI0031796A1C
MANEGIPFRFKRHARIGEAGAELDDEFLFQSFVDVGDYEEIRDVKAPKRIIVGRTGSGKTALLRYLRHNEEHVVELEPDQLSLNFISNNDVIRFFEELGVKLDPFYSLLWKHMLAVELLKRKYSLITEERTTSWLGSIMDSLRKKDQTKARALAYLKDWGDKFWIETESRVKELTTKLASELNAELGGSGGGITAKIGGKGSLTEEQKKEIVYRGQKVVNAVQLKELADVIRFLNEDVFTDDQKPYYVTIDKLDEDWVDDSLRFKLIRALIEAVRSFQKVKNVKVVVALRYDLLRRVFSATADAGFQEEKYEPLILRLKWNRGQIERLLDRRVSTLVRQQYTARVVGLKELFPERIGRTFFLDYLMQRTAMRPRDAILFVNACLGLSEQASQVRAQAVFEAERDYSAGRLRALVYEWKTLFPSLEPALPLVERTTIEFKIGSLDKSLVDRVIEDVAGLYEPRDPACEAAISFMNSATASKHGVVANLFRTFFDVGLVGLRFEGGTGAVWSADSGSALIASQIKPNTKAQIHPMFYQALHTNFKDT